MSVFRAILGGIISGNTPDPTTVRNNAALRMSHLVTLATTVAAVALGIAYQVLRYLPLSWRQRLVDLLGGTAEDVRE